MSTMLPEDMQLTNERMYSRRFIDGYIRKELSESELALSLIDKATDWVKEWLFKDHYPSKNERLKQLQHLDTNRLVMDVIVTVAYVNKPELLVSTASRVANKLGFNNKEDAVRTASELLAIICQTDMFDIYKPEVGDSLMLRNNMRFSDKLTEFVNQTKYLPPMVCVPRELKHNRMSGYLTHNESVILKAHNHHDGDVCLDVLNIHNKTALSLSVEFLMAFKEEPSKDLNQVSNPKKRTRAEIKKIIRDKHEAWEWFQAQSNRVYLLMINQGNKFYLTHRYDKRGRAYASGYHINSQGAKFKKAMLEFHNKEYVEGAPK